jgi:glycerol kinase
MRVDGGAAANDLLMELQAALVRARVVRPKIVETTALGAGMLAALGAGLLPSREALARTLAVERSFEAVGDLSEVNALRDRWRDALARALMEPEAVR